MDVKKVRATSSSSCCLLVLVLGAVLAGRCEKACHSCSHFIKISVKSIKSDFKINYTQ